MMDEHPLAELRKMRRPFLEVKIDGSWVPYGICSENKDTRLIKGSYLGKSSIIRMDGVEQKPKDKILHFWAKPLSHKGGVNER